MTEKCCGEHHDHNCSDHHNQSHHGAARLPHSGNATSPLTEKRIAAVVTEATLRFPFALMILGSMVLRENFLLKKNNLLSYQKKTSKSWIYLLVASIIGTSIGAYLYTESVHIAGANIVSLIATASPLFSVPLTYIVNKEKISKFGFIGVIFTILGVIIILI